MIAFHEIPVKVVLLYRKDASLGNPFGHQKSVVIFEAELFIQRLTCQVGALDFQVQGIDAEFATFFFNKMQGLAADSLPSVVGINEEFIHEGVASVKFKTVADGKRYVTDSLVFTFNQPKPAERSVANEFCQSCTHHLFLERIFVNGVKLMHEVQEQFDVGFVGYAKIYIHSFIPDCMIMICLLKFL